MGRRLIGVGDGNSSFPFHSRRDAAHTGSGVQSCLASLGGSRSGAGCVTSRNEVAETLTLLAKLGVTDPRELVHRTLDCFDLDRPH